MSKLIGITAGYKEKKVTLNKAYVEAFKAHSPVILTPPTKSIVGETSLFEEKNFLSWASVYAERLDALVLSGGEDINPVMIGRENFNSFGCNAERDLFELSLIKCFLDAKKPIFGICKGFQLIGQCLHIPNFTQAIDSHTIENHTGSSKSLESRSEPSHVVETLGKFKDFAKQDKLFVNSWHHQGFLIRAKKKSTDEVFMNALNSLRPKIDVLCRTDDVLEGFECEERKMVAFQFHPEEYQKSIAIEYFVQKYLN